MSNPSPSLPDLAERVTLIFQGPRRGASWRTAPGDVLVALLLAHLAALFARLAEVIGQIKAGHGQPEPIGLPPAPVRPAAQGRSPTHSTPRRKRP